MLTPLRLSLTLVCALILTRAFLVAGEPDAKPPLSVSGRYPHLAMFNHNGECGTGAVVAWADRLWAITYGPHMTNGSDDKLYEIDANFNRVTRSESVGGTPADRFVHKETNQLIIGPYFIDEKRNVRVISPKVMPGRITAAFRSLADPASKINFYMMEGQLWEADVKTLEPKLIADRAVPGWHGKGAYSAQGRIVLANNGETPAGKSKPYLAGADPKGPEDAGVLADFDGINWRIVERRQFTDVTSAGGIYGPPTDDAPLWSIGWDKRSVMLKVLDAGTWHTFRIPKADHSYDGKHGWHTEWPRIREVTGGHFLMNMHGGWFDFPKTMSAANYGGLKPLGCYLKITADFCEWNDKIVFACDDLAKSDFKNTGQNPLSPQSQSNLWFTTWENLKQCGRPAGWGGPWQDDSVKANQPSVPYLFNGYTQRTLHLAHDSAEPVTFKIETDPDGTGKWITYQQITVPEKGYAFHVFPDNTLGQWIRVTTDRDCKKATAYFHYGPGGGAVTDSAPFKALIDDPSRATWRGGSLFPTGGDRGSLLMVETTPDPDHPHLLRIFEIKPDLSFQTADESQLSKQPVPEAQLKVETDDASIILTESGKRFRVPKLDGDYARTEGEKRSEAYKMSRTQVREVVTERSLLNAGGSFYMLPRPISGGAEHIKPICTHRKFIADFGSWRGLLCISGTLRDALADGHYFANTGIGTGLWFGDIDDLWKLGKPVGTGGPWKDTEVKSGAPSDPYLMTGYDKKSITLSHNAPKEVTITIEVNFDHTNWRTYQTIKVPAGQSITHDFPPGYSAHWLRVISDTNCKATAQCKYE